jgi:hypothetical protein
MKCFKCGTCCIAVDISTLGKPIGVRCRYLTPDNLCSIYEHRPEVCRRYEPDEVCLAIQGLPEKERVRKFLQIYGLEDELKGTEYEIEN